MNSRAAFGCAVISSLLYAGLLLAEARGWLPHYPLGDLHDPMLYQRGAFLLAQVLSLAGVCVLAGVTTTTLVGHLRARARELAESNRQAEARTTQLRELNTQLGAANEEYKHSREHLDALYGEMQTAYSRLEVRSQGMSELNEQLRSTNAECKRRREELAEVNNKLQEALRRVELRGENMKELNEQLRAANAECKAQRDELSRLNEQLAQANDKLCAMGRRPRPVHPPGDP